MFQNKLIIIISIVVVVSLGVFGYLMILNKQGLPNQQPIPSQSPQVSKPNPSPNTTQPQSITSNWKTYSNDEYKYEIKYPTNWKFYYPISVPREGAKQFPPQVEYVPLKAVVYFEPTDIKFAEDDYSLKGTSISTQDKRSCQERFSAKAVTPITIHGYQGIEFNATYGWIGGEQERYHIVLCVNNGLVEFQSHLEKKDTLKEMIMTFRPL